MDIQFLVGKQTAEGTAKLTGLNQLDCTNYGVVPKVNKTTSKAIGAGRWERDGFVSKVEVNGDLTIEATTGQLEILLEGAGFKGTKDNKNHNFLPGPFDNFLTLISNNVEDDIAEYAQDCLVSSLKISTQMEAFVNVTANIIGKEHKVLNNKISATPVALKGESLICLGAVIKETSTDMTAKIESIDINIDNKLEGKGALNTVYTTKIRQADRGTVGLNLTFNSFDKNSYKKAYELLRKNTSYVVEVTLAETTDPTKTVKLEFPNVKVSNVEATNLDGAGGMTKELTAYYDKVAQTPVKITFENYHDA